MSERQVWTFALRGNPVSQKNSKRIMRTNEGRIFLASSDDVQAWREAAALELRRQMMIAGPWTPLGSRTNGLDVTIEAWIASGHRIDADNVCQAPLDALEDARVIDNDRWVEDLHVRIRRDIGRIGYEISISEKGKTDMGCNGEGGSKKGEKGTKGTKGGKGGKGSK